MSDRGRNGGMGGATGALAIIVLLRAAAAVARTGAGNHVAAAPAATGGHGSFGGGASLGGLIAFVIIVLVLWHWLRRIRGGTRTGGESTPTSPGAQTAFALLGAALGGSALARASAPLALPPAIDAIRARDPGFELESFLQRAEMTFFLVKRGMQMNDAAAVRPYLDDALFGRLSQELARSKSQHQHELLESLNIRGLALEDAQCTEQGQRVVIHFDLVYRAKRLDDTNKVLKDAGNDGAHGERWTFRRAAQARTPLAGVIAMKCPACGAELRLGLDGVCAHCRASVTNGTVDWVVAAVEPASFVGYCADSALGAAAATVEEGIAALTSTDKSFSIETFEARVRSAFLALQEAWCTQRLDAGRAFMSPGAYFSWSAQLEGMASEGRRNVLEQLEVRRIEPTRVVHGRVFDDLTVRITAAAADYDVDASGKVVFGDRTVRAFQEEWTFQRSIGATTSNKPGTLENTCPSCGAPLALTQIGECRYCRAAVTSGKFDWVVSRIDQEDGSDAAGPSLDRIGEQIAAQVGGAVIGGLLGSLLSDRR